jgi:hypothetical protein
LVGTAYRDQVSTPSIPEATVDAPNNLNLATYPNIALNKPATANSSYGPTYLPSNAVDGNVSSTQWFTNFAVPNDANYTPLPAWIEVDLQGTYTIDSFRTIEVSRAMKDFRFEYWDATMNSGAGGWSSALTVTGNPASPLTTFKTFAPVTTTKVRLYITGHNSTSYMRILELEVYGKLAETLAVNKFEKQVFTIYPNPVTNGVLNISGDKEVQSVEVYNILGTKINIPYNNRQLLVDNLVSGVYFLRVNNKFSFKFIKK